MGGFTDRLLADYDAGTAQVFGEIGYRATLGGVAIKPFAGLAYVHIDADGFTERGGAARLASSGVSSDTLFTTLGVRASADVALAGRLVELRGMAGWRNASGDTTSSVTNAFVTGAPFTIQGAPLYATGEDVDLIIAGTHGRSGVMYVLLGSVVGRTA